MRILIAMLFLSVKPVWAQGFSKWSAANELPTTIFYILDQGDRMAVTVRHLYGPMTMPFAIDAMTPNDLPYFAKKAELLKDLGKTWSFSFPKSECKIHSAFRFECFKGSESLFNGHKVTPYAMHTVLAEENSIAGHHTYIKVYLSLYVESEAVDLKMVYSPEEISYE